MKSWKVEIESLNEEINQIKNISSEKYTSIINERNELKEIFNHNYTQLKDEMDSLKSTNSTLLIKNNELK